MNWIKFEADKPLAPGKYFVWGTYTPFKERSVSGPFTALWVGGTWSGYIGATINRITHYCIPTDPTNQPETATTLRARRDGAWLKWRQEKGNALCEEYRLAKRNSPDTLAAIVWDDAYNAAIEQETPAQ